MRHSQVVPGRVVWWVTDSEIRPEILSGEVVEATGNGWWAVKPDGNRHRGHILAASDMHAKRSGAARQLLARAKEMAEFYRINVGRLPRLAKAAEERLAAAKRELARAIRDEKAVKGGAA